jgi:crotonobetainyl-CoA hydratase
MLPWPRAVEVLLSETFIKADRAEQLGLATRVVPRKNFKAEVDYYILRYLKNSGYVRGVAKKAARAGLNQDFAKDMEKIKQIYLNELAASDDYKEGYKAFTERRDPVWKDK